MKVKNIMFFGFAAAILSAGAASAAPHYTTVAAGAADNKIVTSKSYVDSKDELLNQDIAEKQDKIVAGTNITIGADGKTISATDTTYTADGTTVALNGTTFSANTTGGVAENGTNLVTGGQVASAIADAMEDVAGDYQEKLTAGNFINIDSNNNITTTYSAGTNVQIANDGTISATDTTYTASGHASIDANNNITVADNGAVANGNTGLVTGGTVYTAIADAMEDVAGDYQEKLTAGNFINIDSNNNITTTYSAGTNVQIANDGTISATDTTYTADGTTVALNGTTFSANTNGGVGTGNGNLVTGGQVQTAIDGAIADVTYEKDATCTAGVPCALVDDGTTKKWYGMAI